MKRVSLKDIAEKTGFSVPTISQILNGKDENYSSESTKKAIRDAARDLGYKANFGYKVMRGYKTKTVSIIISAQRIREEKHIQELILRLVEEFDAGGYSLYMSTSTSNAAENIEKIYELISRGVESFVFIGAPMGDGEIRDILTANAKNFIAYNSHFEKNIYSDSIFGMEAVLRHFLGRGCRNVKLVMDKENLRFQGVKNVFPELSEEEITQKYFVLNPTPKFVPWAFNDACFQSGYEATKKITGAKAEIDGLVYLSDYFALGGVKCLLEKGYKIGEDVLVSGYNYVDAVKYSPYPISSVEHDIKSIASLIVENMLSQTACDIAVKPILHMR